MGWGNMSLEDLYRVYENKKNWHSTDNKAYRSVYNMNNNNTRAMYGMTEKDDISMGELSTYIAAAEKQLAGDNQKKLLLTNLTNSANNGNAQVQRSADALRNFNYDPSKDAAYQSYVDMYNRQGQSAAKQTMNNLAATNMGRGSSYSAAATAQVQQAYAQKASEMIPALAQQAYDKLLQQYNVDRDMANDSYNRQLQAYQMLLDTDSNESQIAYQNAMTKGQELDNSYKDNVYEADIANKNANTELTKSKSNLTDVEVETAKIDLDWKNKDWATTIAQREATTAQIVEETLGLKIDNSYKDAYWESNIKNIDASTREILVDAEGQGIINEQERVQLGYLAPTLAAQLQQIIKTNEGIDIQNSIDKITLQIQQEYGMSNAAADLLNKTLTNDLLQKEKEYYNRNADADLKNKGLENQILEKELKK